MQVGVDFTHVIMTRFNVARPKRQEPIRLDPDWLAGRFDLFERYCLPSVAAQTARGFHWLVYFDEETPEPIRARIEACRRVFPFVPCFTGPVGGDYWPASIGAAGAARTPWLLTTRFDNDDALSADHVARLQAALGQGAPVRGSLNFPRGFVLEGGKLYALTHLASAFASWLEPWDDKARTAISINHLKMARVGPVRQLEGPPAWLQVVHGGNVSNKIRGRRVGPEAAAGRFPTAALAGLRAASGIEITLENLVLTPIRSARDTAVSMMRGHERVVR
jgi:Putative rhamnosyl transferase